jgi:hypothetical protein
VSTRATAATVWAKTETGIERLAAIEALRQASAQEVRCFTSHNIAVTLPAMTKTARRLRGAIRGSPSSCRGAWRRPRRFCASTRTISPTRSGEGLCEASAQEVYRVNLHDFADTSWAMTP